MLNFGILKGIGGGGALSPQPIIHEGARVMHDTQVVVHTPPVVVVKKD